MRTGSDKKFVEQLFEKVNSFVVNTLTATHFMGPVLFAR